MLFCPPLLFGQTPRCVLKSLAELAMKRWKFYIVWSWTRLRSLLPHPPPPRQSHAAPAAAPTPTLQLGEWDVSDLARCHIWHHAQRERDAYWSACACYSKLWLPFATEPAPLHTSLNCVARKFSASRARINQRVPLTKTTLLDLLRKVCLSKTKFPQISLCKK